MQVVVEDVHELQKIRDHEADVTKARVDKILTAGANVVMTTKGIDDMCLKYFVEAGVLAVRYGGDGGMVGVRVHEVVTRAQGGC